MRILLIILMAAASAACTGGEATLGDHRLGPTGASAVDTGPKYASEAQRARAQYYWLPQNQLPPDAGVAPPAPEVAATTAPAPKAGIF